MVTFRAIVFGLILYYIWDNEMWEGFGIFLMFFGFGIMANQLYKLITTKNDAP